MREYELVILFSPNIPEGDIPGEIEKVSQFVTQKGGAIIEVNRWGRRRLAYPIKYFLEGDYVVAQFKFEPNLVEKLEANLKASEGILRYLLVRREG